MAKLHKGNATRELLIKHLIEGICKITFVKVDGSVRNAYCTLHENLIPTKFVKSIEKIFLPDARQEILPYWDVVQGKWKSFYIEKLELFITADELKKDLPLALQEKEEKAEGGVIQSVDENKQQIMDKQSIKRMQSIDKDEQEKTVIPSNVKNKNNIQTVNTPKRTFSAITKAKEKQKENLEKSRNIINRLRKEAEDRRRK